MAEQFAFEQRFGDGAHIHFHKIVERAFAFGMNGLGDEVFTGAVFAQKQHIGIGFCHPLHRFKYLFHSPALENERRHIARFSQVFTLLPRF